MLRNPHLRFALAFGVGWLCLAGALRAEDSPQFRGTNRDGVWHEKGLLPSFPADGLKVRWRQPVGPGWSSPVVAEGRVFVTDAQLRAPAAQERVRCFSETTGELLWTHADDVTYPDWAFVPGQGGGPCATPIVEAGKVYVVGSSGAVFCLEAKTGGVLWSRHLERDYQVPALECRSSPLIEGDLLILFAWAKPGACVMALHKETGVEAWKALDESVSSSSPLIVTAGGRRQLIAWTGASVTSLDPTSGATFWREPMVTSGNDSIPTPVCQGRRLLIGGLMMELSDESPSAKILWPEKKAASKRILSHTSTAVLQGDLVFSAKSSGELVCLEAVTGRQIWEEKSVTTLRNGSSIHLTPCEDAMYLFTDRGDLIRAHLSSAGYQEVGRTHLLEPTSPFGAAKFAWTPPAFANGHVFARNDEEIVCASLVKDP